MKKVVLGFLMFSILSIYSCKSDPYNDFVVYKGKDFDEKSFFSFLGPGTPITTSDVDEFNRYRDSLLNGKDLISNYKDPIDSMTVGELNKFADSSSKKEEVIFIFGLNSITKKLSLGIISSLGYPKDNKLKAIKGKEKWLPYPADSNIYIKYRDYMISQRANPYLNFQGKPFVAFSKNSLKKVTKDFIKEGKWEKDSLLYFHYGYSKDKNGKHHVAILFTPQKDISNLKNDVGFANRGGTCCPPEE